MDFLYDKINDGFAAIGVDVNVSSLPEAAGVVVGVMLLAWLIMSLVFD